MFRKRQIISSFAAGSMLAMIAAPASAVLIDDTDTAKAFFGGDKTSSPGTFVEVIGSTSKFQIYDMELTAVSASVAKVKIHTEFIGTWGNNADTDYGDLLLHAHSGGSGWTPLGAPPNYKGDEFTPVGGPHARGSALNEWNFAVRMSRAEADDADAGTPDVLYTADLLKIADADILTSNDEMAIVYPGGPPGFRDNQAVAVSDGDDTGKDVDVAIHYDADGTKAFIEFTIAHDGLLGDSWAASWAMTCANDIVQGDLNVPEPATLALFSLSLLGAGMYRRRTRTA